LTGPDLGAKLPPNLPQPTLRPHALGTPLNRPHFLAHNWPSGCRSARKSARFAVDTTDFFADFLAASVASLADQEVRRSHTLGIRLARLRRPVTGEIRCASLQAALPGCH
jgi:hypothetical protein